MAIKALNGFGWFLTGVVVAPGCYLVSSQVASERARVEQLERAIAKAHKDIRGLETEFDTRANLAQLERWNGDVMRYTAPTPAQFLPGDTALAQLRPLEGDGLAQRYAAMVVPEGVPEIVAGARTASDAVPAVAGKPAAAAAVKAIAPSKPVAVAATSPIKPATIAAAVAKPIKAVPVKAKDQAVAALDSKLLKDSSFGDLMQGVRAEAKKIR
ncbi:hypothetical protein [Sphingomonas turrisvirgatae]|uniref:Colicin transporter n=1 Tax=Sphingomonas turrisvirgatae TaxID=1888892 RepID=A0A1E3LTY5_9SPHN|nr:hypothetical protein [Sphingomonas turrisvirgatae]ODP36645.1 hypothetical protein BFL28_04860 [Sphingomonas turrisvirgatae]